MEANKVHKSETEIFYGMIGMLECGISAATYLLKSPHQIVHRNVKQELQRMVRRYEDLKAAIIAPLPPAARKVWEDSWGEDYGVYGAVFGHLSQMTVEQRQVVEEFCDQLRDGRAKYTSVVEQ